MAAKDLRESVESLKDRLNYSYISDVVAESEIKPPKIVVYTTKLTNELCALDEWEGHRVVIRRK